MSRQLPELLRRQLRSNPLFCISLRCFRSILQNTGKSSLRVRFSRQTFLVLRPGHRMYTEYVIFPCCFFIRRSISARVAFKNELVFGNCRIFSGFRYLFQKILLSGFFWYFFLEWINHGGNASVCETDRKYIVVWQIFGISIYRKKQMYL